MAQNLSLRVNVGWGVVEGAVIPNLRRLVLAESGHRPRQA